jgi:hypothetical protein
MTCRRLSDRERKNRREAHKDKGSQQASYQTPVVYVLGDDGFVSRFTNHMGYKGNAEIRAFGFGSTEEFLLGLHGSLDAVVLQPKEGCQLGGNLTWSDVSEWVSGQRFPVFVYSENGHCPLAVPGATIVKDYKQISAAVYSR